MNKFKIFELLRPTDNGFTVEQIITNLLVTLTIALFIYLVYKRTYSGVLYCKNFNVTVLLTTMVTSMIMMVIGSNLALSLGMVGALSIIRFRSAIKDPRDVGFLFWGVSVGLAAGTGSFTIAIVGSAAIAIILFVLNISFKGDNSYMLVIRGNDIDFDGLREEISTHVSKSRLRMRNSSQTGTEVIYEIKLKKSSEDQMVEKIKKLSGISVVNIVSHNGEING